MRIGAPPASAAMAWVKPNTPHSGSACSTRAPGASSPKPAATSRACCTTPACAWQTNFGARVVPEVVKITQRLSAGAGAAVSAAPSRSVA
jgi:hypothetical protein